MVMQVALEEIRFSQFGLRHNVALVVALRPRRVGDGEVATPLLFANTHILFNPKRGDIKLGQVSISERANTFSSPSKGAWLSVGAATHWECECGCTHLELGVHLGLNSGLIAPSLNTKVGAN